MSSGPDYIYADVKWIKRCKFCHIIPASFDHKCHEQIAAEYEEMHPYEYQDNWDEDEE
jgi:hypothetical protein